MHSVATPIGVLENEMAYLGQMLGWSDAADGVVALLDTPPPVVYKAPRTIDPRWNGTLAWPSIIQPGRDLTPSQNRTASMENLNIGQVTCQVTDLQTGQVQMVTLPDSVTWGSLGDAIAESAIHAIGGMGPRGNDETQVDLTADGYLLHTERGMGFQVQVLESRCSAVSL